MMIMTSRQKYILQLDNNDTLLSLKRVRTEHFVLISMSLRLASEANFVHQHTNNHCNRQYCLYYLLNLKRNPNLFLLILNLFFLQDTVLN